MYKQDAMYYVNEPSFEVVAKYGRYEVVRNGYMKIIDEITGDTYRYTSDLDKAGYEDEKFLIHSINSGNLNVVENPWFEVWDSEDLSPDSEVFDTHQQACKAAWELAKQEVIDYVEK